MIDEKKERAAFARWIKRAFGLRAARLGKPAQDQYVSESIQNAWQGWWARAQRGSKQ